MEKHRLGLLTKLVMISMMTLVVVSVVSAQTVFTRNGDFVITENLNVSGDINNSGDITIGGVFTGNGSGLTDLDVDINNFDLSAFTQNDTTLFGNVSNLRGDVLSLNDSINNLNASSPTDELQDVITSVGSQSGNFTTSSQNDAINLTGQDGGTTVTNSGNIFTFALNAINSIITSFTNFVTFGDGIGVTGDINATGTINGTSFIGDGSQLTGIASSGDDGDWVVEGSFLYNNTNGTFVGIGTNTPIGLLDVSTTLVNINITNTTVAANTGVVAFYRFEEGDNLSLTTLDSSGFNNNGTLKGDVNFVSSKGSNDTGSFSLDFPGSADYVVAPNSPQLNFTDNFSISLWIFPPAIGPGNTKRLVHKNHGPGGGTNTIQMLSAPTFAIRFGVHEGGVQNYEQTPDNSAPSQEWSHVVGIVEAGTVSIYINTVSQSLTTVTANAGNASTELYIGTRNTISSDFNGQLDEVTIFNRTLNQSEITDIFNNGITVITPESNTSTNTSSGGTKFLVREDGHINVTGTSARSTFEGDVEIIGTLFGGSPVKVHGGMNILTGDFRASNSIITNNIEVRHDLTANSIRVDDGTQSVVGNLQVTGNLSGGSPLKVIGGMQIVSGDFLVRNESGGFENLLATLRQQAQLIKDLRTELEVLKSR